MRTTIFKQLFLTLVFLVAVVFSVGAQSRQGNRWLIVADTSLAMQTRSAATQNVIEKMILSGMSGQLRPGDTIGMWSFNEQLHTGEFPLQLWVPESARTIAARTGQFIKKQGYEKTARFDKIIPALKNLVTNSPVITVILITDGSEEIAGTPYDSSINTALKTDYAYQKKMGVPYVITFRGEGGRFSGYTVNLAPWPVTFTPLPPEPEPMIVKKTEPEPKLAVESRPAPVVPSLIISGKKPELAPQVQPVTPVVEKTVGAATNPEPFTTKEEASSATPVAKNPPASSEPVTTVAASTPVPAVVEVKPLPAPAVESPPKREEVIATTPSKENISTPAPTTPLEPPAPKSSSTEVAAVTPAGTDSGGQKSLLIGLGLLVLALALGIFWLRRPRHAGEASLITRSLDKDKK